MPPHQTAAVTHIGQAAVVLTVLGWLLMPVLWLWPLPLTRAVRVTGTLLVVALAAVSATGGLWPGRWPVWSAVGGLVVAALWLSFVIALGRVFRQASAHRRAAAAAKDTAPGSS